MKLGSLFDGIGGFPLAAGMYGIEPIWASEIEPFPIKVTEQRFPNMKHLGDITKVNGAVVEPVDIITAGSPCQDLSVAGKRAGLEGARSGLFMEFIRIVREMREVTDGRNPRYVVWENVPGAFSSNGGQDFRAVLEEIAETEIPMPESGRWATAGMVRGNGRSLAWRVLDAQYHGVPQRRKRIFLVADLAGQRAGEILFEREGVSGDLTESGEEGQDFAGGAGSGVESAIFDPYNNAVSGQCTSLGSNCGMSTGRSIVIKGEESASYGVVSKGNGEAFITEEQHMSLGCGGGQAGQGYPACLSLSAKQQSLNVGEDIANTLGSNDHKEPQVVCLNDQGGSSISVEKDDVSPTLRAETHGNLPCIAFQPGNVNRKAGAEPSEKAFPTLGATTLGDQFPHVAFARNQRDEVRDMKDKSGALQAQPGMKQQTFVAAVGFNGDQSEKTRSMGETEEQCPTLRAGGQTHVAIENHPNDSRVKIGDTVQTLTGRMGTGGGNVPMVMPAAKDKAYNITFCDANGTRQDRPNGGLYVNETEKAGTVTAKTPGYETAVAAYWDGGQTSDTLDCSMLGKQQMMPEKRRMAAVVEPVMELWESHPQDSRVKGPLNISPTVSRKFHKGSADTPLITNAAYTVRRLTPLECERLQGFPDGWTDIEGASDTARYKALGNSVAVPCVVWIMSSLFPEVKI